MVRSPVKFREMAPKQLALHIDFMDAYGDLDIQPEDWFEENGKLILDLKAIKERKNHGR